MNVNSEFLRKANALRADFISKLSARFESIRGHWGEWSANTSDFTKLSELHRNVHSLAGAGTTFGYPKVSSAARELDQFIKEFLEKGRIYQKEDNEQFQSLLSALVSAGSDGDDKNTWLQNQSDVQARIHSRHAEEIGEARVIYLVEDDLALAKDITHQIKQFGFEVRHFVDLATFRAATDQTMPSIVVMDLLLPDGDGAAFVDEKRRERKEWRKLPVIFTSVQDDIASRLKTVRAGGFSYLAKPVDMSDLIDQIDAVIKLDRGDTIRVLIVDDAKDIATHTSAILAAAGCKVDVCYQPLLVLEKIREFAPDLILMDFYMPDCNGLELARVIRQHSAFVSIPIVYVTSETDAKKKMEFVLQGGDDYLAKPIVPEQLFAVVEGRVKRSRLLRGMMLRDSLTGLYNHSTLKENLSNEITRAGRIGLSVIFAMIDIDYFKKVNDSHGHMVGDRVIKTLARMLQQRLRRTDIIGRYGGEEFGVILLDTNINDAINLLNEIRVAFSETHFYDGNNAFQVTFSAGVAEFPGVASANELCEVADAALYDAKAQGRNRVVRFQP